MSTSQPFQSEPSFPTQAELRTFVDDMQANPLARQLFFDSTRFRSIVDLDGIVIALNDYAERQRGADVSLILDRPMWEDPLFSGDPLWAGRLRSRFAEALASEGGTIEYEDRVDFDDASPLMARVRIAVITNAAGLPLGFVIDSTDVGREHRSRALVREQQRLLHVVFERTFQLIAILDPTGEIIDINHAISRIGLTRDNAVGRKIQDISDLEGPGRGGTWQSRVDAMQTATEPRRYFDASAVTPAGVSIATDISMTPVRNDDGTLDLILLEFRDQTERYEAEQRLRESEERFRALAETLPQMVWSMGPDGGVDYISPNWLDFTGKPTEELLGRAWLDIVHPDDRPAMEMPSDTTDFGLRVFRMRDSGGEYRWLEAQARAVLDDSGAVRRWYGATLDVTERREAEEAFRSQSQQIDAAAELTGLGSFVWDIEQSVLRTDARYKRILQLDLGEHDIQQARNAFFPLVHDDDRERVRQGFAAAMTWGGPSFNQQYRMRLGSSAEPEERWIACVARVEFNADRQPVRLIGAIQDVTSARRQDEERVRIQKVEAIGTLVGAIAHDFNNVIGAILTYARVAEAEIAGGEAPSDSVAEIARGARRAADILGRLMAFGREETPRRLRFDPAEIVEEAVALLRPAVPSGAELDLALDDRLPPLDGDPTQIHQVIVNLVTNACQAVADRSDGLVAVRASAVDLDATSADGAAVEPGRYVRITVQDNGAGFDEGVAHRLFDPFFTTKPTGKGTGLGLAAVQSIVRAHHGTVTAQSPQEGGALFSVLLPVVADAAAPSPSEDEPATSSAVPNPTAASSERASAPRVGPIRALFVDDEPALVRLAGRAMPYRDIEVSGHVDATAALAAFIASPDDFDVLVTDLSMPVMSGFELIDRIREIRPELPIVLTSGYLGPLDEQGATQRGINAVLPKPCSIDALASAVQRITGR